MQVKIPDDWKGKEVHLVWDSNSEALLYSETGVPLQGFYGRGGLCACSPVKFTNNWSQVKIEGLNISWRPAPKEANSSYSTWRWSSSLILLSTFFVSVSSSPGLQ